MNKNLDDRLILQDCLSSLKDTASLYNVSAQEAANKQLKDQYLDIHRKTQNNITQVFDEMNKKGWYNVTPADQQTINSTKTVATTIQSSMGM